MSSQLRKEIVLAYGHPNIQAIHPSTLMFTREKHLSRKGDCIIAVAADKATADLSADFKHKLREPNAKLIITIEADDLTQQIRASGSPKLGLTDPLEMVVRKSDYISDRTIGIYSDKSSNDLPREFVEKLKNPNRRITITLTVS